MDHADETWLLEHLFYEWSMLDFTMGQLQKLSPGNEYNVYHESFAIHARLMSLFLTNRDTGNYGANEFVKDFRSRKPDGIKSIYNKIDPQIMHLAPKRASEPGAKLNRNECKILFDWLKIEFQKFLFQLPEVVQRKWDEKVHRLSTISINSNSLQTATNHVTGITTSVTTGNFSGKGGKL